MPIQASKRCSRTCRLQCCHGAPSFVIAVASDFTAPMSFCRTFRLRTGTTNNPTCPSSWLEDRVLCAHGESRPYSQSFACNLSTFHRADHFARELVKLSPLPGQERGQHALHFVPGWPISYNLLADMLLDLRIAHHGYRVVSNHGPHRPWHDGMAV